VRDVPVQGLDDALDVSVRDAQQMPFAQRVEPGVPLGLVDGELLRHGPGQPEPIAQGDVVTGEVTRRRRQIVSRHCAITWQ
jgi:hypothetical protein